ncbi:hypothetical protein ACFWVC_01765 [Streptomyces sp. NPDC058691]|uniref:hypothetical protein n=1 Tax=Streptomyces sp. NPDC058691 TaxID=3346601 RepID=UPI00365F8F06
MRPESALLGDHFAYYTAIAAVGHRGLRCPGDGALRVPRGLGGGFAAFCGVPSRTAASPRVTAGPGRAAWR